MHALATLIDWKTLLCFAAVSIVIETLLPLHRRPLLRSGLGTDALYVVVNTLIVRFGLLLVLAALVTAGRLFVPHAAVAAVAAQPLWLQIPEAMLIGDFCLYWAHRALHAHPYLWRLHAIHHAIEELDWLAAFHMHPLDELVLSGAAFGSVCILGFSSAAISFYVVTYTIFSVVVHLNTRLRIGPVKWLCGSPEFHHWHHSNEREARDRNFAAIFSLWDVMFGTAFLPGGIPKIYGTDDKVPRGYVDQMFHPIRRRSPAAASGSAAASAGPAAPSTDGHVSQRPAIP